MPDLGSNPFEPGTMATEFAVHLMYDIFKHQAGQKEVAVDLTRQMEVAKLVQLDEAAAKIQKRLQSLQELPGKRGKIEEYDFAAVRLVKGLPAAGRSL